MNNPPKPNLDQLIAALTAQASAAELAGRDAAAGAFRAATGDPGNAPTQPIPARSISSGISGRVRGTVAELSRRALLTAATVILIVAGLTAGAYTRVLPGPVQNAAHTVFAPLGVPGGQPGAQSPSVTDASSASATGAKKADRITLVTTRVRATAGAVVTLGGRVTERGSGAAGVGVRLYERLDGTTTWQLVASGRTGPRGGFRLLAPPMTTSAVFRVVGPDGTRSAAVRVAVGRVKAPASASSAGTGTTVAGQANAITG